MSETPTDLWAVYSNDEFQVAYPRKQMAEVYASNFSDGTKVRVERLKTFRDGQASCAPWMQHKAGCRLGQVIQPKCPQCGEHMNRVRNRSGYLNDYQFDAVKKGDWFCKRHEETIAYLWDSDCEKEPCSPAPICGLSAHLTRAGGE